MQQAGERVPDARGRLCFVPAVPAAPSLDAVWDAVQRAGDAVAAFDRGVAAFPVADVLGMLFARLDAVHSSQAEGTTTTFSELIEYQATRRAPDPEDAETVATAAAAWADAAQAGPGPLSAARRAHARLFAHAKADAMMGSVAGGLKVVVNATPDPDEPNGLFHFCPPEHLDDALARWQAFSLATDAMPELVRAALAHWMFEHIHPFHDGNGRIGRLLIPVTARAKGVTRTASAFCGEAVHLGRHAYIDGLTQARCSADWSAWTRLMLGFIERTAIANLNRLDALHVVLTDWRAMTRRFRSDSAVHPLLEIVLARPKVTPKAAATALRGHFSYQAVLTAIAALERLGIVRRVDARARNRLYEAPQVMTLFARPDPTPVRATEGSWRTIGPG
jgi:Fic family protein